MAPEWTPDSAYLSEPVLGLLLELSGMRCFFGGSWAIRTSLSLYIHIYIERERVCVGGRGVREREREKF